MSTVTVSPKARTQNELWITRVFDAPRELVWKAWTDPEHMAQWFGPRLFEARNLTADVRPGGKWRNCLHSDGFTDTAGQWRTADLWQGGEYLELVEPERLVFTFHWEEGSGLPEHDTVITITLAESDGKTTMNFHQTFFVTEEDRDGHGKGWNSSFDKLEDFLAR
ncbi:SRPBCC domain-containing protein [Granulicella sp. S190]|uniref:SRPBCC domain-containing protein n=1 Tax=Granulicella sp. S190 TaxID=1747226 RepID=UPI00131DA61C|nr:SRPBCC domain-containing protein [Granulicella sp. S190]